MQTRIDTCFSIPSLALLLHLPISLSLPTHTCNWKTTGHVVSRSGVNPTVIHSTFAPMAHTDNILIICIMCASVSMLAQVSVHLQIETGKKCRLHVRDARSSCKLCVAVRRACDRPAWSTNICRGLVRADHGDTYSRKPSPVFVLPCGPCMLAVSDPQRHSCTQHSVCWHLLRK